MGDDALQARVGELEAKLRVAVDDCAFAVDGRDAALEAQRRAEADWHEQLRFCDQANAECRRLESELAAMRPVIDAVRAWKQTPFAENEWVSANMCAALAAFDARGKGALQESNLAPATAEQVVYEGAFLGRRTSRTEPTPPVRYRHWKGDEYDLIGWATESTTGRPLRALAVYRSVSQGKIKVRDVFEFRENVNWPDGVTRPRFTPVDELEKDSRKEASHAPGEPVMVAGETSPSQNEGHVPAVANAGDVYYQRLTHLQEVGLRVHRSGEASPDAKAASPPTVNEYLAEWLKQPGTRVTASEWDFIVNMRAFAASGVGYGWMQDIIEVEWNSVSPGGAWGPRFYETRLTELEKAHRVVTEKVDALRAWLPSERRQALREEFPELHALIADLIGGES